VGSTPTLSSTNWLFESTFNWSDSAEKRMECSL